MKGSSEHRVKKTRLGMEGGKRGLKPRASSQPVADGSSLPLPPPSVVWRGQGTTPPPSPLGPAPAASRSQQTPLLPPSLFHFDHQSVTCLAADFSKLQPCSFLLVSF